MCSEYFSVVLRHSGGIFWSSERLSKAIIDCFVVWTVLSSADFFLGFV